MRYLEYCDMQFTNLEDMRFRISFTLILFSTIKGAHIIRKEGSRHPTGKITMKQKKNRIQESD